MSNKKLQLRTTTRRKTHTSNLTSNTLIIMPQTLTPPQMLSSTKIGINCHQQTQKTGGELLVLDLSLCTDTPQQTGMKPAHSNTNKSSTDDRHSKIGSNSKVVTTQFPSSNMLRSLLSSSMRPLPTQVSQIKATLTIGMIRDFALSVGIHDA